MTIDPAAGASPQAPTTNARRSKPVSSKGSGCIPWFLGVILPLACLLVGGGGRNTLLSPVDQFGVLGVALGNFALLAVWPAKSPRICAFMGGWALGFASYYTIVFAPLYPGGLALVIVFLLGLLVLAPPLAALIALLFCQRLVKGNPSVWRLQTVMVLGIALGVAVPGYPDLKTYLTARRIDIAYSESGAARARALQWLRESADLNIVQAYCSGAINQQWDSEILYPKFEGGSHGGYWPRMPSAKRPRWFHPRPKYWPNIETLEYSITGKAPARWERDSHTSFVGRWDISQVGTSSIEGTIDPESAVASLVWRVSFRRIQTHQIPARFSILLPGKSTLEGIHRVPDPQAIADPNINPDDSIRFRKLDPQTARIDLYNLPRQGFATLKIGFSLPLVRIGRDKGQLELPALSSLNVRTEALRTTQVSLSSDAELRSNASTLKSAQHHQLTGSLELQSHPGQRGFWIRARLQPKPEARLQVAPVNQRRPIIVLADVGRGTKPQLEELAKVIESESGSQIRELVLAHDAVLMASDKGSMLKLLKRQKGVGGFDSNEALSYAIERARKIPNAAVVWICGEQIRSLAPSEASAQWMKLRASVEVFVWNPKDYANVTVRRLFRYPNAWRMRRPHESEKPVLHAIEQAGKRWGAKQ